MKKLLLLFAVLLTAVKASAENYILYTSSDGKIVTPYNTNAFGANIVSNTYENGQGKILFDGEVTTIGSWAFSGCSGLASMEIPNSVTTIGYYAFSRCSSLTSLEIPNSVTEIGGSAFYGCYSLPVENNLRYADTYLVEAVDKTLSTYSIKKGTRWIGSDAFSGCRSLTSVEIPNSITEIGRSAFSGCSSLTSVEIPNSVTKIGDQAFSECSSLTSVVIPNSVTKIGDQAFSGCSSLTSVVIPNSVMEIRDYAFRGCSSLTSVIIPESVTSIGVEAFGSCNSLIRIIIKGKSVYMDEHVFAYKDEDQEGDDEDGYNFYTPDGRVTYVASSNIGCRGMGTTVVYTNLFVTDDATYMMTDVSGRICDLISYDGDATDFAVPATVFYSRGNGASLKFTVANVGQSAFAYNKNLKHLTFENQGDVGSYTCYGCSALQSVAFNNLGSVGDCVCYNCSALQSVVFENQGDVGPSACYGCSVLQNAIVGDGVTAIQYGIFSGCSSLTSLTIGRSVMSIASSALSGTKALTSVQVSGENTAFCDIGGVICSKDGTQLVRAPGGIESYVIPGSVTMIGDGAFSGCTGLTSMEIPNSVMSIGRSAFGGCTGLTSMEIPNSVMSIGRSAFYDCTGLTSVVIGNSVKDIGGSAFFGCTGLTSMVIGNSVTSIGNYAFYQCRNLKELKIPHSVTSIGEEAFEECTQLESLYLGERLNKIGSYAFRGCTALANITSTNVMPPTCGNEAFSGVDNMECWVLVREEALRQYQAADVWKNFLWLMDYAVNYIEKQPTSDDVSVVMHDPSEEVTYQWCNFQSSFNPVGSGAYPWEKQSDGSWKSTNKGKTYTTSSLLVENIAVKAGDELTFDYAVSNNGQSYGKLQVLWNGSTIMADKYGQASGTESYTFPSNQMGGTLEFRYRKEYYGQGYGSVADCATVSNIRINGRGALEPIPDATAAELDLSTLSNIDEVCCVVTLSDGIQLTSDVVKVSTEALPTYSVVSYCGNNSATSKTMTISQLKKLQPQDNELVFVDANIGIELQTNFIKRNGGGEWVTREVNLADAVAFYCPANVQAGRVNYTRHFTSEYWQPFYLPYALRYEEWADKVKVARISNVHQYDDDDDGVVDRTLLEFLSVKSGSLKPNVPYVVMPLELGETTFSSANVTLTATPEVDGSVDCRSTTVEYTLCGTYQQRADLYVCGYYSMVDGDFVPAALGADVLAPFRTYLKVESREEGGLQAKPQRIGIMVDGVEEDATGIQASIAAKAEVPAYNLSGQCVGKPTKAGVYIVDGKKMLVK